MRGGGRPGRRVALRRLGSGLSPGSSGRAAVWVCLLVLAAAGAHVLLVGAERVPWVFYDELGYQKLAQSLGESGRLALFGKQGLSYFPLYPLLLSPLYALGLSGPGAYHATLVVNCLLLASAGVPIYAIARSVLTPARSALAVALSLLAPLMLYSGFEMSESLAYPLFLLAVWALLVTVRAPGLRADALFLVCSLLAAATRFELVALVPAGLCAVLLAALVERRRAALAARAPVAPGASLASPPAAPVTGAASSAATARQVLRRHGLLATATALLAAAAVAGEAGSRVGALAGQYAVERNVPLPTPWAIAKLLVEHLAGLDIALGAIPFAGAVVASLIWLRRGRAEADGFAVVAVAVTAAVLLTTAIAAYGQSYPPGADLSRIHERYMIYLVPLFVIAMVATLGIPRSSALFWLGLAGAALAALLPAAIPFGSDVNRTIGGDTFGLLPFAVESANGVVRPVAHAAILATGLAGCLGVVYALGRPRPLLVAAVVAAVFVAVTVRARSDQLAASRLALHAAFSSRRDWVDAAVGNRRVPLIENPDPVRGGTGVVETAFFNLSVDRLYAPCTPLLSGQFGEEPVRPGPEGRLLSAGKPIRAAEAVVPIDGGIEGRVIASDRRAGLAVVAPAGGVLTVAASSRGRWTCPAGQAGSG